MAELQETLTAEEFQQWAEFYDLEPFGADAAFLRSGIVASVIANVNRDPKQRREPFQPKDFMPGEKTGQPAARADGMDSKRIRAELLAVFGGKIRYATKTQDRGQGRKGTGGEAAPAGSETGKPGR